MKLGIIARSDNTGLGNQTRELVNMLNPNKVLLIDSSYFNGQRQHHSWYEAYNVRKTKGFATKEDIVNFLDGLDVVISCEIFYSNDFISHANKRNVKTILQYNYEFLDYLANPDLQFPTVLLSPSSWYLQDVLDRFGKFTDVQHLPPPTATGAFLGAREANLKQNHGRILHIAGKAAVKDRNGTQTVIQMMKYLKSDVVLDIRSQSEINLPTKDSRINIINVDIKNHSELYSGYDAMILPRRYAGLCLPMNEALISGLPVFMTDISPNNTVLPPQWLAKSTKIDQLMTRTMLDVYEADPVDLAKRVDEYLSSDTLKQKNLAVEIGESNFSPEQLLPEYEKMLKALAR